ncbi:MAG: recombination protein O N-terminal domain-containing protein [bacterium]|nr:recombination protein O N-terminal domain-containing protein [bacterium]
MIEYCTEAIVLAKEDAGEADSRVFLYTPDNGLIIAKSKSTRKITSKLAAHLEPLNWSTVRLVNNKSWQIVDALRMKRLSNLRFLEVFRLVKEVSAAEQPDQWMWQLLKTLYDDDYNAAAAIAAVLKIAGFDPQEATCHSCQSEQPNSFLLNSAKYICQQCLYLSGDSEPSFKWS